MTEERYDCRICANAATAICRDCRYVQRPGGETTKPSKFIKAKRLADVLEEEPDDEVKEQLNITDADDLAVKILAYLADGTPIPIRLVIAYNMLAEDEEAENAREEEIPR